MAAKKKPVPKKKAPARKAAPARKRAAAKAPKEKNPWGDSQKKLDSTGEAAVCAALTDGTMLADIAKKAGVSSGALLSWLNTTPERSARAREARKLGAAVLEERAQAGIEAAGDNFALAKAKELAHHLRWKASKLDPRAFGDKLALGQASDLPPLPAASQEVTVHNHTTFEVPPAEAYAQMLARKG